MSGTKTSEHQKPNPRTLVRDLLARHLRREPRTVAQLMVLTGMSDNGVRSCIDRHPETFERVPGSDPRRSIWRLK